MLIEGLLNNFEQMREISREIYVFSNQLNAIYTLESEEEVKIDNREKKLLEESILTLTNQLKILNNSIPKLMQSISIYKKFPEGKGEGEIEDSRLTRVKYKPSENKDVSLLISDSDKKIFLENLSKSRLSINKLKKKYSVEKPMPEIGATDFYANISNLLFRKISDKYVDKDRFRDLNMNLRRINSKHVLASYLSIIFFTIFISFIFSFILFVLLLFFDISITFPFISIIEESIIIRFIKYFWIVLAFPIVAGILIYFFPYTEAKNLGAKMDAELPFVTIHMSAIASSGIEPVNVFKIILEGGDYRYVSIEFKKLMNLINFHGEDITSALEKISRSTPSAKLSELLSGLVYTIRSGGDLHNYLNKHAETMLFDYRLLREKSNKVSETLMDLYISIAIAAPMILLMIFVIMAGTGFSGGLFNLSIDVLTILLILAVVLLNIIFMIFLKLKQTPI